MWSNSWVLTRKATDEVVGEVWDVKLVARINPERILVEPTHEYLARIHREICAQQRRDS